MVLILFLLAAFFFALAGLGVQFKGFQWHWLAAACLVLALWVIR